MAWQAFLLFSISAGVVPPLPPSSNVRSDDRHHRRRHISCVICAQSVRLLRLQKERGMGQTTVGGREKSRFCLSACLSVSLSASLAHNSRFATALAKRGPPRLTDGSADGRTDIQFIKPFPFWSQPPLGRASRAVGAQLGSTSTPPPPSPWPTRPRHARPNGSVAFDRLSAGLVDWHG